MIFDGAGRVVDEAKADHLSSLVWQIIEEAITFSQESHDKHCHQDHATIDAKWSDGRGAIPETLSLYDFVEKRATEIFPDEPEDRELLLNMSQMWGAYIGHPIDKQSLRFAWLEKCCIGGSHFPPDPCLYLSLLSYGST